jgi:hypothetical protein
MINLGGAVVENNCGEESGHAQEQPWHGREDCAGAFADTDIPRGSTLTVSRTVLMEAKAQGAHGTEDEDR